MQYLYSLPHIKNSRQHLNMQSNFFKRKSKIVQFRFKIWKPVSVHLLICISNDVKKIRKSVHMPYVYISTSHNLVTSTQHENSITSISCSFDSLIYFTYVTGFCQVITIRVLAPLFFSSFDFSLNTIWDKLSADIYSEYEERYGYYETVPTVMNTCTVVEVFNAIKAKYM